MAGIAKRARVPQFTTHTLRRLGLTDLARAGWDIREIARFAGPSNLETTIEYLHVSGQELTATLERGTAQIHAWRITMRTEVPG